MIDNPVLVLIIVIALILVFLAIFVVLTYFLLKMASDLERAEMKKK